MSGMNLYEATRADAAINDKWIVMTTNAINVMQEQVRTLTERVAKLEARENHTHWPKSDEKLYNILNDAAPFSQPGTRAVKP
jgi:hypothetical protein